MEGMIALGMIETKGLVGAVEAADAMCKAAFANFYSVFETEVVDGSCTLPAMRFTFGSSERR